MPTGLSDPQLTAVAHDVRSLHNVGSIYRTADAAGFSSVICSGYSGAPPDPRIAKVALGAEANLTTERIDSLPLLVERLADSVVVVLEQNIDSVLPEDVGTVLSGLGASDREIVLIACGELTGAPDELIERADMILELPMRGSKESLNVSVAFGIAAFALAAAVRPYRHDDLRSRQPVRAVREGVLTRGVTRGEIPEDRA